jgi:hypothetical protein
MHEKHGATAGIGEHCLQRLRMARYRRAADDVDRVAARPFPAAALQFSNQGGNRPRWRPDHREVCRLGSVRELREDRTVTQELMLGIHSIDHSREFASSKIYPAGTIAKTSRREAACKRMRMWRSIVSACAYMPGRGNQDLALAKMHRAHFLRQGKKAPARTGAIDGQPQHLLAQTHRALT